MRRKVGPSNPTNRFQIIQHNGLHSLGRRCASSIYATERAPSATRTWTALLVVLIKTVVMVKKDVSAMSTYTV